MVCLPITNPYTTTKNNHLYIFVYIYIYIHIYIYIYITREEKRYASNAASLLLKSPQFNTTAAVQKGSHSASTKMAQEQNARAKACTATISTISSVPRQACVTIQTPLRDRVCRPGHSGANSSNNFERPVNRMRARTVPYVELHSQRAPKTRKKSLETWGAKPSF